jgi:transaldolase
VALRDFGLLVAAVALWRLASRAADPSVPPVARRVPRPTPSTTPSELKGEPMTTLERLYTECGQSPWLDNLTRGYLRDGTLARMVAGGIRGVTANPTIFSKAIVGSADYDEQFAELTAAGWSLEDAYWQLVVDDITAALAVLRPTFDASGGTDGFVSIEVAAELAHDTQATLVAARALHKRIAAPNLFVTLPETTIAAFTDHGTLARTIDTGVDEAAEVMRRLSTVGVDMDDVGSALEEQGVAGFHASYQQVLAALAAKADQLSRR